MSYKWKPSKTAAREFAQAMKEIDEFCSANGIQRSAASDSYYFRIDGKSYRVSNHTVEASNRAAFDSMTGEKKRELYHDGRSAETIYIHASKTRIIEIYKNLLSGKRLDGFGNLAY